MDQVNKTNKRLLKFIIELVGISIYEFGGDFRPWRGIFWLAVSFDGNWSVDVLECDSMTIYSEFVYTLMSNKLIIYSLLTCKLIDFQWNVMR